jgi:mono/diheme cytochrome c family protein
MNTRQLFTLLAVMVTALAGTAVYAQHKAGQYEPGTAGKIARPLPQAPATGTAYDVGPFPTYSPTLAVGEGSREVDVYCNTCHSPMYITMQPPLSADTWAAEVAKMQKAYGADIPDEISKKIIQYLGSHYTPETRKR